MFYSDILVILGRLVFICRRFGRSVLSVFIGGERIKMELTEISETSAYKIQRRGIAQ
jgi:hypothetical protein